MTTCETFNKRHADIKTKLKGLKLPTDGTLTQLCWNIGTSLKISGPTVKNYLNGDIKDGFLAEAIYAEFRRLRYSHN